MDVFILRGGNNFENISEENDLLIEDIDCDMEIAGISIYLISEITVIYLSNLKKNDIEKYNRVYNKMLNKIIKLFDKNIFNLLETNINEIVNIINEEIKIIKNQLLKIKKYCIILISSSKKSKI